MKILSFDVGIINLAYCIVEFTDKNNSEHTIIDWNIINCADKILSNNLKCCVNRKGIVCNKDAISKVNLNENKILGFCSLKNCQKEAKNYKKICNIKKKTSKDISLNELALVLFEQLNEKDLQNDIDLVLIENQPALKNPTMKSIQIILFSYFIFFNKNLNYDVKLFNASKKLSIYNGPKIETKHIKNSYNKRKFLSIEYTKYYLEKYNNDKFIFFNNNFKKDDLADCYLQTLSYFYKKI